jgi:hypothetical protein
MANPEYVEMLKQGVEVWNEWRKVNPSMVIDLSDAYLPDIKLHPKLEEEANFSGVNFSGGHFFNANFISANLADANFSGANLNFSNLTGANLKGANLRGAFLLSTNFYSAELSDADMTSAILSSAIFGETTLKNVRGLDSCIHQGRSTIDHQTLAISGKLPLNFLRGCGLPDTLINYIPSLLNEPIQFYSCFISYSSKDQSFAERLHADLQNKGVRCWFAPEDLKIGAEIRVGIDESIRVHDKLLLVLSETSVKSQWVQQEVETALAKERDQGRTVLFPIRLDDAVMEVNAGWPSYLRNTRNIGDFTSWKDHDSYSRAFDRLLRDLKAGETKS